MESGEELFGDLARIGDAIVRSLHDLTCVEKVVMRWGMRWGMGCPR